MAKAAERQLLANKFIQDALAYAESARRLDKLCGTKPKTRFVSPMYFLLGHAIELTLKAYLLASGVSAATLRNKVGHDLKRALQHAKNHGSVRRMIVSQSLSHGLRPTISTTPFAIGKLRDLDSCRTRP
jgi:hypothetical protein